MLKSIRTTMARWAKQRALQGAEQILNKKGEWGFTVPCLVFMGELIGGSSLASIGAMSLKGTVVELHSTCIDQLTSDLFIAQRTILRKAYVEERLAYHTAAPCRLSEYLTLVGGHALSPAEAWGTFHSTALDTATALERLEESDADDSLDYYLRRYENLFKEVMLVHAIFVELAGYNRPIFT